MDPAGISALLSIFGNATASVLLVASWVLFVVALYRKAIVFGWIYEQKERQNADQDAVIKALSAVIAASAVRRDDAPRPASERRGDAGTAGLDRREKG